LKKAAQKLLLIWAMGVGADNAPWPRLIKFFCFFCSQKEAFASLAIDPPRRWPNYDSFNCE
jgi:hypothetical protein